MVGYASPPKPRELLPPFLACLPTAFASPRPPPALLPLLSPILRQRVQLLCSNATTFDSWLPLLCWEPASAERLPSIVESDAFELHPVSGEIEFREIEDIAYRRLDEETLQTRIKARDLGLDVIYLWCEGDSEGGGDGWRVSELYPSDTHIDDVNHLWWRSIELANEKAKEALITNGIREAPLTGGVIKQDEDNDDEDYWAQYDNPGRSMSAQPTNSLDSDGNKGLATTSDTEYYAQYSQIQPAMDQDDLDEDRTVTGESTLDGNVVSGVISKALRNGVLDKNTSQKLEGDRRLLNESSTISHPRASSSSSKGSVAIERLEDSAVAKSVGEIAVQQHISTSFKSLFRLARGIGIERAEFSRIIYTELQTLSIIEEDD